MKVKPILPSLREKKRYLVFEVLSKDSLNFSALNDAIYDSCFNYLGDLGMAKAGILTMKDKYSNNKGIIRVNHKNTENLKSALMLINKKDVLIRTLGVSGILKKAENKFLAK